MNASKLLLLLDILRAAESELERAPLNNHGRRVLQDVIYAQDIVRSELGDGSHAYDEDDEDDGDPIYMEDDD